jgi:hypothetical protein
MKKKDLFKELIEFKKNTLYCIGFVSVGMRFGIGSPEEFLKIFLCFAKDSGKEAGEGGQMRTHGI